MDATRRPHIITIDQASRLLDCSDCTLDRILDAGRLPFIRNENDGLCMADMANVMDYQRQKREHMHSSMAAMRRAAQEIAMDDAELAEYVAQFD